MSIVNKVILRTEIYLANLSDACKSDPDLMEIASDVADLILHEDNPHAEHYHETNGDVYYTDLSQDLFNRYYGEILTYLQTKKDYDLFNKCYLDILNQLQTKKDTSNE